jgi:Family of unknown function (DUF6345)/Bacterial Ig domain
LRSFGYGLTRKPRISTAFSTNHQARLHRARLGALCWKALRGASSQGVLSSRLSASGSAKKGNMKKIISVTLAFGVFAAFTGQVFCQTNLQFTGINRTDEGAIQLHWASQSNHVYEIDEADSLNPDTNSGTVIWNKLYDDYPSQGTNTFIGDFGNYNLVPQILNPKDMPMRFYRIVDQGADSLASDEPNVSIVSPTNGSAAVGELTITVVAATDQPIISSTELYVDGQQMQMADSTTNWTDGSTNYEAATYSINTCEWGNETHTLFATAESESGFGDTFGSGPVASGHGVSPFVPVLFSNLISRISFSQPSFDPSSGQTQQVSAVFANNSDWTLNIVDVYSNVVQTASGSGTSMLYNWDGTSDGTNLPNGIYYYYIYAQTNGESDDVVVGGSSASTPSLISEVPELWVVAPDSENVVPLAIYPPGFDTNGFTIFSATPSEVESLTASASSESSATMDSGGGGFSPDASGGGSSAGSQGSPNTPQRPPNNPVKGLAGTFGIAYDTYSANGTNGFSLAPLLNGLGIPGDYVQLEGNSGDATGHVGPLLPHKAEANNFLSQMQHWGWNNTLLKVDDQLKINDLIGSGTPFNNVNLGVLLLHGVYGTSIDYNGQPAKQIYYPVTSGGSAQYLRLEQMNLGGSGTNGLKWMAIMACNSLFHTDWQSMQSAGGYPYNSNLHLLLGVDTTNYTSPSILQYWAQYMNYGTSTNYAPLTIRNAWYQAARQAYADEHQYLPPNTVIKFSVAGDSACFNDSLQNYSAPGGSWTIDPPVTVFSN